MNKRAIIIGATSGIGREVAILLAQNGWTVGVAGRRENLLNDLVNSTAGVTCYKVIDVNDNDAPVLLSQLIEKLGGMDLYLHSTGIGWQNEELDVKKEICTVETNAMGFTRLITAAFRYFSEHGGGQLAAISSIAGTKGLGAAPSYSASKAYQQHYLESLQQLSTIRHNNITITDIRPGFVATDLIAGSNFPMQLKPSEVARTIVAAINSRKKVITIDWRYRILTALWRIIPRSLWVRMKIKKS